MRRVRRVMRCGVRWCVVLGMSESRGGSVAMVRLRRRMEVGCVSRRLW